MFAIAIDGPAGAGKSTIAKALAKELNFIYVDTGALYRTVALYLLQNGINTQDIAAVNAALPKMVVEMSHEVDGQHVYLNGKDVTAEIRTEKVSMEASTSSKIPEVRAFLFTLQTNMAQRYNVIMDGRDIATVVLPNAQVKVFLTASPEIRAKRRQLEYQQKGIVWDYEALLKEIKERDDQDANREVSPLKPAADGVILDTSYLDFDGVIQAFKKIVAEKRMQVCG